MLGVARAARALAIALAAFASGCGPNAGVLLEVTTRQQSEIALERLVVRIGAQVDGLFVEDPDSQVTVDVSDRDLVSRPYRVLVNNGRQNDSDAPIIALALGYGADSQLVAFADLAPQPLAGGEVQLRRLVLEPRADVRVATTGCVSFRHQGAPAALGTPADEDCDGYRSVAGGGLDCDDRNPEVHPAAVEICGNGRDDDCDGVTDEVEDIDGDGFTNCDDCNDGAPLVYPGAPERCDGQDDDCDGVCDEGFDLDGDGVTRCGSRVTPGGACQGPMGAPDCLDDDFASYPGAPERCDGQDNDCNGVCDDGLDGDGDGFTSCGTLVQEGVVCGAPAAALIDCDDDNPAVHPFAHEVCDGVDDNCDGVRLTVASCYRDVPGVCALGQRACDDDGSDGSAGLAPGCSPMSEGPVDGALCAAYAGACAADADPFLCASTAAAATVIDCDLAYLATPGSATAPATAALCPGSTAPLPPIDASASCSLKLLGGMPQEQETLALFAEDDPTPHATLSPCAGSIGILALGNDLHPVPDDIVLLIRDLALPAARVALLHLSPRPVAACPSSPLGCKMRER